MPNPQCEQGECPAIGCTLCIRAHLELNPIGRELATDQERSAGQLRGMRSAPVHGTLCFNQSTFRETVFRSGHIRRRWPVGSRTGAVFRRSSLAVAPRFLWECLSSQTVNPFPAPATSHPACRFPALGAPVCLVPRVMWLIVLERLSRLTIDGAGSC